MLTAYINYPNAHVTIHATKDCSNVQQQRKSEQRVAKLNIATASEELRRFEAKDYRFGADQRTNDMWLFVDFSDPQFERAVVGYIHRILARHYLPFSRIHVNEHCNGG